MNTRDLMSGGMLSSSRLALSPYPAYKDSGVSWLGRVPAHWQVLPHRALFQEVNERGHPDEPLLSVTIARGIIPQEVLLADSSKKDSSNLDKSNYKLVQPGDIAYNKMRAWQGALGVSKYRGIVSPAYIVVRPRRQQVPEYYHYLLRTPGFITEAERWSYGITSDMWSLRSEDFKRIYGVLPPLEEQRAIAHFLAHIDRVTRRYIRAQHRLIELLEEQKQALIQQAVTRGLDPDTQLIKTDIPWLPIAPDQWVITKLGHFIHILTGFPFPSEGFSQSPEDIKLLRGINIAPDKIRWDSTVRWENSDVTNLKEFLLEPGDIVFGMDRPIINKGIRAAMINEKDLPCLLLQRVARLRTHRELDTKFLYLLLHSKSFKDYLAPIFTGISVPHVSPTQINSFIIAIPPPNEQKSIVSWVESATEKLDNILIKARRRIALIREYRTRLIADVVTGKLDVRRVKGEV